MGIIYKECFFMKKSFFPLLFPLVLLASCTGQISDSGSSGRELSREFGEYSDFGSSLKDALNSAYSGGARSSVSAETENDAQVYTLPENQTGTEFLLEGGYVSPAAADYMQEIEELLDADYDELDELLAEISKVEERALARLSSSDLDSVMYFAESAKASLEFWTEADCNNAGARGFRSWLKKKANRIKKAAISAGIGAVVGGAIGFVTGGVPGAVAGAIAVGAASCGYGYSNNAVSVSVKISK